MVFKTIEKQKESKNNIKLIEKDLIQKDNLYCLRIKSQGQKKYLT